MTTDLTALRQNYARAALSKADLPKNPVALFGTWFERAIADKLPEPYAFSLATAGRDAAPSVRTLLLRGYSDTGFKFYTNYESEKGQQLSENPKAQMLFFWHALEQQVRISGSVEKLSEAESVAYFHARPHDSQLGAWVSQPQSGVVASREVMEAEFSRLKSEHSAGVAGANPIPKPPAWGGYILRPNRFEFWQGRPNRMHDRLVYESVDDTDAQRHELRNDKEKTHESQSNNLVKFDAGVQKWRILRLYP